MKATHDIDLFVKTMVNEAGAISAAFMSPEDEKNAENPDGREYPRLDILPWLNKDQVAELLEQRILAKDTIIEGQHYGSVIGEVEFQFDFSPGEDGLHDCPPEPPSIQDFGCVRLHNQRRWNEDQSRMEPADLDPFFPDIGDNKKENIFTDAAWDRMEADDDPPEPDDRDDD